MTTLREITFGLLIFMGIAMAEPTLEKQFEQGLNEAERTAFYEIFGNNNQEGEEDEQQE
ncbi:MULTISPECIES: hypothetical protein [unclassified Methylophaga]|jgi:hypothetical protein|uniref:hypothetical protein n=1 Tax=unclassified Methylophaga TaxID=2629249 RepID=UPI0025EE0963|nr:MULTISPECIES: hypothetical protein [unclassified Methylophaga]|tara:strand:+ start:354 stop:530 length:177 start_codon:yes stop_codon:yes gene_type:complete